MRLIRLALTNFRQHADTELVFRSGLTGIIGPNGSGKTTILEAIAWAIYGAAAVRGTNETLRFNRAPGRSSVRAELEFELRGERYRVVRTPRAAELYRAEGDEPIAAGIAEVTRQLTRRLGMTRREFFNTYFTGQKELQFLAAMGAVERARFLSQVLGYERLRAAQELVRDERRVLKGKVDELRRALADPDEIRRTREAAETRLKQASAAVKDAEGRHNESAERFAALEPGWNELQKARDRDRQLSGELRVAGARLEQVLKKLRETDSELAELGAAAEELEKLSEQARPLVALRPEVERLRKLAEAETQRAALEKQLTGQRQRVEALAARIAEQDAKGRRLDELTEQLAAQEAACEQLEAERDETLSRWQRDKQDADATLRILRDQAEELKSQIEQLKSEGPQGVCPTCKRPLGSEFDQVLTLVRRQFEEVVQDGLWHQKRLEQLRPEPGEVVTTKQALVKARGERERLKRARAEAESASAQAAALRSELAEEEARARALAGEIAGLPVGYEPERHAEVQEGLERLGVLEKGITQLETRLERLAALRSARAKAAEEERQIRASQGSLERQRTGLGFSEQRYNEVGAAFEAARLALEGVRLDLERARVEADAARGSADAARRAEREHRRLARSVSEREAEYRLHNQLDGALGALRDELNDRVRPELSELASVFLTELTDGRYNQIEINPEHEVVVLDDGEEKPVISGGEQDLANLVLRLAISQMIAERAGHALSLLIFDEVFGGLDDQRRESVIRLLQRLQDRFEQVILITHIEPIREWMDQVVRVAYDDDTGASVLRLESSDASPDDLQIEDLPALVSD